MELIARLIASNTNNSENTNAILSLAREIATDVATGHEEVSAAWVNASGEIEIGTESEEMFYQIKTQILEDFSIRARMELPEVF
jgi:fructose/tagatose bisphosphate aldolase